MESLGFQGKGEYVVVPQEAGLGTLDLGLQEASLGDPGINIRGV